MHTIAVSFPKGTLRPIVLTAIIITGLNYVFFNFKYLKALCFRFVIRNAPLVHGKIQTVRKEYKQSFLKNNKNANKDVRIFRSLPEEPIKESELMDLMHANSNLTSIEIHTGSLSGIVYRDSEYLDRVALNTIKLFTDSNPLHADVFVGTRKIEAEIVRMVAGMFNGDDQVIGSVTSGGSESLILAVKTYRDRFVKENKRSGRCELVLPSTAHPAILKGCHYFGIDPVCIEVDPANKKVRAVDIVSAISPKTCAIFLSAPSYPHGVPTISGVTSISCDTHKYGLCPKGSSVLIYRNSDYFAHQIFAWAKWPGGVYGTPTIAGSRPGMISCAAYATMLAVGERGYREQAQGIYKACQKVSEGIKSIEGLSMITEPQVNVVSATCNHVYELIDLMKKSGWILSPLQDPPGFHIAITQNHLRDECIERLIFDLKSSMDILRQRKDFTDKSELTVLYGSGQMLRDTDLIEDLLVDYFVSLYTIPPSIEHK
ncbi:hypothetical protein ACOME3_006823 [Neoechinorhynchus agilis]